MLPLIPHRMTDIPENRVSISMAMTTTTMSCLCYPPQLRIMTAKRFYRQLTNPTGPQHRSFLSRRSPWFRSLKPKHGRLNFKRKYRSLTAWGWLSVPWLEVVYLALQVLRTEHKEAPWKFYLNFGMLYRPCIDGRWSTWHSAACLADFWIAGSFGRSMLCWTRHYAANERRRVCIFEPSIRQPGVFFVWIREHCSPKGK